MRTTVTLDDDVYEAAQAYAQATGKRLGRVLSEMARQALQPSAQQLTKAVSRFPTFSVPAEAPLIPGSRIQKALDEDGIVGVRRERKASSSSLRTSPMKGIDLRSQSKHGRW